MKSANLAAQNSRMAETGLVWEEKASGAPITIEVFKHATIRVRAAAGTTVTIDGVLAMTMGAGEIEYFNAGAGLPPPVDLDAPKPKATVTIAVTGNAFVQVAREKDRHN